MLETDRERLLQVEVKVKEQEGKVRGLSQQVRDFEKKVDSKFTALDAKMTNQFKWLVGINVTMWALTVTVTVTVILVALEKLALR